MTIRSRTKHTFGLFIISSITFITFLLFLIYQYATNSLIIPEVYFKNPPAENLIFGYNPLVISISVFIELLYVIITTFVIYRSFVKTQSSIVTFFLIFLLAVYSDSIRLLVPLFHISHSFSKSLVFIGNITLFSRILAPMAILVTSILSFDEQTLNLNKYCLAAIFSAMFMAYIIPLNTTNILPNFCVSYGYYKTIHITTIILNLLSVISIFISNLKSETKQYTTIGYLLLCLGYSLLFFGYSLATIVMSFILIGAGTVIYLNSLHQEYLWK